MPSPATASRRQSKSASVAAPIAAAAAPVARAWQSLAGVLQQEIAAGRHPVGARLPTEEQLGERFGLSRSTVRAALARLEQQGMVLRRPKTGTVVKSAAPTNRYAVSVGSLSDLLAFLDSTLVMPQGVQSIEADAALAAELGSERGSHWLRVGTLRTPAGGTVPISLTDYYLPPRFRPVIAQIGRRPGPVYPLLERRYGVAIARIEQDIGACLLPAKVAKALSARAGAPALRVIHRMVSERDGPIYCTISLYPADRFRYVQALQRTD